MGSMFRSEEMCLAQLYLQSEAAFACVSELGELGLAQFRDLNPDVNAFQRKFVNEVRRCDEMERKLRFLERELKKDNITMDDNGENPLAPLPREMIELEAKFEKLENDMKEVNMNQEALKRNFLELTELKHILRKTQNFFEEAAMFHEQHEIFGTGPEDESAQSLLANDFGRGPFTKLGFVAGVVLREKVPAFERVLWRACRGNVFLRHTEIETPLEDPHTGDSVNKCVFIIFFQGDQLKTRVKKICEGFQATLYPCPDGANERHTVIGVLTAQIQDIQVVNSHWFINHNPGCNTKPIIIVDLMEKFRATLYPCPETPQERREIAIGVMTRIEDLQTVLNQTDDHRRLVLSQVARSIRIWFIKVRKIKSIYHTLNLFNVNIAEKCLIAECWIPVVDLDRVQLALRRGTEMSGSSVPSILQRMKTETAPPTYNRTDMFTYAFQNLIDAFGIANYREVNPAPYTIITFPFLFAVMFGDVGHGLLMFLFGLYLVINEKRFLASKNNNEIWEMMFGGRYLILLMGLFSMYTGFLYNECFSRSINIFGSSWNATAMGYTAKDLSEFETLTLDPKTNGVFRGPNYAGAPYAYGMDPIWQSAFNKITFSNSYKMKSAVILGTAQMIFGLILAFCNHIYFKDKLALYCEWIPQMLFLLCIIGYLCIMIIYKWIAWTAQDSSAAPSLLIGLINMFMFTAPSKENHTLLYVGQNAVQTCVVVVAVLCIPWMLFAKPIVLYLRHKKQNQQYVVPVDPVYNPDSTDFSHAQHGGGRTYGEYARVAMEDSSDEASIIHHDQLEHPTTINSADSAIEVKQEEFVMSELMIHQIIHTIEFCLNCISHTASYLRLWALSLAHAELSEVLWTMVMHLGLSMKGVLGAIMTYLVFWGFAMMTIGILLVMEGLSAFLHALRLHWVEFQSKFYKGQGYMFAPFSFEIIVEGKVEE